MKKNKILFFIGGFLLGSIVIFMYIKLKDNDNGLIEDREIKNTLQHDIVVDYLNSYWFTNEKNINDIITEIKIHVDSNLINDYKIIKQGRDIFILYADSSFAIYIHDNNLKKYTLNNSYSFPSYSYSKSFK